MKRVSVTELKNKLSAYLRLVKEGETVEILERKIPVARLERIDAPSGESRLERLARAGIVTRPRGKPDRSLLRRPPVECSGDVVRALIDERGDR